MRAANKKYLFISIIILVILLIIICYWKYNVIKKERFLYTNNIYHVKNVKKITITNAENNTSVTLNGFFVYDENGKLLDLKKSEVGFAGLSSTTSSLTSMTLPSIVLDLLDSNKSRTINDALNKGNNINNNFGLTFPENNVETTSTPFGINFPYGFSFIILNSDTDYWSYQFKNPVNISCVEFMSRQDCCPDKLNLMCTLFDVNNAKIGKQSSGIEATKSFPEDQKRLLNSNQIHNVFVANASMIPLNPPSYSGFNPIKSFIQNEDILESSTSGSSSSSSPSPSSSPGSSPGSSSSSSSSPSSSPGSSPGSRLGLNTYPSNWPEIKFPQFPPLPDLSKLPLNLLTPPSIDGVSINGYNGNFSSSGMGGGISTDIIQTNFSGDSNIYSPFLYYTD
jgi:hypothetical protein